MLVVSHALFCQALCHTCDAVLMGSIWSIFCLNFFLFLKRTVVCIQPLLPWFLSMLDAVVLCARLGRWGTALLSNPVPLSSGSTAWERRTAKVCTSLNPTLTFHMIRLKREAAACLVQSSRWFYFLWFPSGRRNLAWCLHLKRKSRLVPSSAMAPYGKLSYSFSRTDRTWLWWCRKKPVFYFVF